MKTRSIVFSGAALVAFLALASASNAPAALRHVQPVVQTQNPGPQADLLRQAYAILARGDHDYKGHRVKAMRAIEAAGKAFGMDLRGDGKGHEPQPLSDDQLRTAQNLLTQARAGLTGKPAKHVEQAINQLSIALTIK